MYFDPLALEAFIAVCETGNFTVAARRLNVTQSAVSQRISSLERDLCADLFDRKLRPIVPTPAGEILYRKAQGLLAEGENIISEIRERSSAHWGDLRLGITEFFCRIFIPEVVESLREWTGNLTVAVASSFDIGRAFLDRKIHIAITTDPLLCELDLQRYELCSESLILAVHRDLLPADSVPIDLLAWLAEHRDFISYSPCSPLAAQIKTALRRDGVMVEPRLLFNSSGSMIDMVAKKLGWAVTTPLSIVPAHCELKNVHFGALGGKPFKRSLFLIARAREFESLQVKLSGQAGDVLRDIALPLLREMAPWLSDAVDVAPFSLSQMNKAAAIRPHWRAAAGRLSMTP